jgi:hypothetical protein
LRELNVNPEFLKVHRRVAESAKGRWIFLSVDPPKIMANRKDGK